MRTATRVTSESSCCPKCKYCVKGQLINPANAHITCPECGNCFRLDLKEPEQRKGLFAFVLCLGVFVPFLSLTVFLTFIDSRPDDFFFLFMIQLPVYGVALLAVHLRQPGYPGNRKYGRKLLVSIPLTIALNVPTILLFGALLLYAINSGVTM